MFTHRPAPLTERTEPEIPIMFSPDQVPTQVEGILHRGMRSRGALGLPHRLETTHPSLSNPGRLMRLFCSVIFILLRTVNRLGYQLTISDTGAS